MQRLICSETFTNGEPHWVDESTWAMIKGATDDIEIITEAEDKTLVATFVYWRSETPFSFGPMTEEEAIEFENKIIKLDPENKTYGEIHWSHINDPRLFTSGIEVS